MLSFYASKKNMRFVITCFAVFYCFTGYSQTIIPTEKSYGIDHSRKWIIYHLKLSDSIQKIASQVSINFENQYPFTISCDSLLYTKEYTNAAGYRLYITKLPIIKITADDSIIDASKRMARLSYYDSKKQVETPIGIELRGNTSLSFPKKSYDLDLWQDDKATTKAKIKFTGLRKDDDWILDGIYDEPLRLRSYTALKLWKKIHQPHYILKAPKAKSSIDLNYVEVFLNESYKGLYTLTEKVDRKLLRLKKNDNDSILGTLFKASSYDGGPAFQKAPKPRNIFPHWAGFEMKYPVIDYTYRWDTLYTFVDFVIKSDNDTFKNKIDTYVNLENAIDYFLFINMLGAADNMGKNYYLARYDDTSPFFFVPWDLDGVLGTLIDGQRIASNKDILSNGLFDRLISVNPNNFNERLVSRWEHLRTHEFSDTHVKQLIEKRYNTFNNHLIYKREAILWEDKLSTKDHLNYLNTWLAQRLLNLDQFIENIKGH